MCLIVTTVSQPQSKVWLMVGAQMEGTNDTRPGVDQQSHFCTTCLDQEEGQETQRKVCFSSLQKDDLDLRFQGSVSVTETFTLSLFNILFQLKLSKRLKLYCHSSPR